MVTPPARPDGAAWPWFDCDAQGRVLRASEAAARLGVTAGMPVAEASMHLQTLAAGLHWEAAAEPGTWRCAPALPATDGPAEQRLLLARSRLHDEVRRRRYLERQLISVAENEQRRISLELHDGLGQHLSGLAYTARSLAQKLGAEGHALAKEADWTARLLRDAVGRVRAMSRGLWPVSLERQSLPQALAALAQDIEQLYGITVQVRAEGFEAESAHAAHHLFRITQESINNALKHGRARNIEVRLERVPPNAMLSIVSDGAPMKPPPGGGQGLGLVGMQLRADALGGDLSIEPLAAGGVEVCLIWPAGRHPDPGPHAA